jgi:hypothetical protein
MAADRPCKVLPFASGSADGYIFRCEMIQFS